MQFKDDAELALLTKSYNKVKPSDYPLNVSFAPAVISLRPPLILPLWTQGTPLDPQHAIFAPAMGADAPAARRKLRSRVPSPDEHIRKLHEECTIARTSVQMLFESLAGPGMDPDLIAVS